MIKLEQFDMNFCTRMAIKGQALADFLAVITYANTIEVARMVDNVEAAQVGEAQREKNSTLVKGDAEQWTLYVDDTSNDTEFEASIMLISPEGHKMTLSLECA